MRGATTPMRARLGATADEARERLSFIQPQIGIQHTEPRRAAVQERGIVIGSESARHIVPNRDRVQRLVRCWFEWFAREIQCHHDAGPRKRGLRRPLTQQSIE
jgi:hypothetical protein